MDTTGGVTIVPYKQVSLICDLTDTSDSYLYVMIVQLEYIKFCMSIISNVRSATLGCTIVKWCRHQFYNNYSILSAFNGWCVRWVSWGNSTLSGVQSRDRDEVTKLIILYIILLRILCNILYYAPNSIMLRLLLSKQSSNSWNNSYFIAMC